MDHGEILRENQKKRQITLELIGKLDNTLAEIAEMKPPVVVTEGAFLPTKESFSSFYLNLCAFGQLSASLDRSVLTVGASGSEVKMSVRGVCELLAEKFGEKVLLDTEMRLGFKANFVEDMDAIVNNKLSWLRAEFGNKVLVLHDPRIPKLCEEYHRAMSVPLVARLKYHEWERGLLSYRVQSAVGEVEQRKNGELRRNQEDYSRKADELRAKFLRETEVLRKENLRLKELAEKMEVLWREAKDEADALGERTEGLHARLKDETSKTQALESDLLKAKTKVMDFEKRLEKYELFEWELDITSSPEEPVYCNVVTNQVFKLPVKISQFREKFSLARVEGGDRIYSDGEMEIVIPAALATELLEMVEEKAKQPRQKLEGLGLTPADKKVYNVIAKADHPLTVREILDITKGDEKNLRRRHLSKLVEANLVAEGLDGGVQVYSKV